MLKLTQNYAENITLMDRALSVEDSYDIISRDIALEGRKARMYLVDGLVKDGLLFKIMSPLLSATPEKMNKCKSAKEFTDKFIPYMEVSWASEIDAIATMVLSGPVALIVEGYDEAIMIDSRTYPTRSLSEPESDRVMRGARDSFCETLVLNTALIRRHVRDTRLTMKYFAIGTVSQTDVVLCYFKDRSNQKTVEGVIKKLSNLDIKSLSMKQESLVEALVEKGWYNPFPKVRYTERPDTAAATVAEGGVLIIVDGTPAVMLLPTGFIDFFQDTNDYYFPPVVGTYLRTMRFIIYLMTFLMIPVWYLLIKNPEWIPWWLDFIRVNEMNNVPIFVQLMLVELIIDCLKQASLNTPSSLGGSFSVVAALILGEFAVKARWFVPEVLLYMAFVSVANFAQPSFELGYAVKLSRMMLIVLTGIFNAWGFVAGLIITLFFIGNTHTVTGQSYLYPLIPFNGQKLMRLLFRRKMNHQNS